MLWEKTMDLTPAQIDAEQKRLLAKMKKTNGRGRTAGRGRDMNRTERAYAQHLLARMIDGDIIRFDFQAMKFRLASGCWYEPDFLVMRSNGLIEIHEVKGFMEDDAAVKLRVFAEQYWCFRVILVRLGDGNQWTFEERTR